MDDKEPEAAGTVDPDAMGPDDKPDYVTNFQKPKGTVIKHIKKGWYLYKVEYQYDPITGRTTKNCGHYLGTITENGLRPPKRRGQKQSQKTVDAPVPDSNCGAVIESACTSDAADIKETPPCYVDPITADGKLMVGELKHNEVNLPTLGDVLCSATVQIGAVEYLYSKTERMRENLKVCFPTFWPAIYVVAMVRAIYGDDGRLCRIEQYYKESALAYKFPNLQLNKEKLGGFLSAIGMQRDMIVDYMKRSVLDDEKYLLVDGHRVISLSRNLPTAKTGYESCNRYKPKINIMYIYAIDEKGNGYPAFYRKYAENIPDVSAMDSILSDCNGLSKPVTVIGDEGTGSGPVFDYVAGCGCNYIFAIQRGCAELSEKIPDTGEINGMFSYHNRAITHFTVDSPDGKNKIILYRDLYLFANELSTCCRRTSLACEESIDKLSKDIAKKTKTIEINERKVKRMEDQLQKAEETLEKAKTMKAAAESAVAKANESVRAAEKRVEEKWARADMAREQKSFPNLKRIAEKGEETLAQAQKIASTKQDKLNAIIFSLEAKEKTTKDIKYNINILKKDINSQKMDLSILISSRNKKEDTLFCELNSKYSLFSYENTKWKGTFALKTNRMDLTAEQIYVAYKQSPTIDGYFNLYDNTLKFDYSYLQGESSVEGWLFLNHLSSTMALLAMDDIAKAGMTSDISFMGLMGMLGSLRAQRCGDIWDMEPYDSNLENLCTLLNFKPGTMEI